jgi:hypothetical protein
MWLLVAAYCSLFLGPVLGFAAGWYYEAWKLGYFR